ncbi:arylsulfotransferase family protein [uncultured Roseobacter sp.]|uniref:arylsulfotransferase family protein n=1 Tax=uncultured Roseobacter sp. TaxID=114847 RepID=UPI002603BF13|nr:arylsulfotransferase family protein [uncultured Roseobacter sp.]
MFKNPEKLIFAFSCVVLLVGAAFIFGAYSGQRENAAFLALRDLRNTADTLLTERGDDPVHFLQPARHQGSGVITNTRPDDGMLIFVSGFFDGGNEMRLMQRDGTVVARWPVRFSEHFPDPSFLPQPPQSDWNVDLHGALVNPDGSVVFNYEYSGSVKLSPCGDVLWTLDHPTHHSVETAESGGYWIPGRSFLRPKARDTLFPHLMRMRGRGMVEDDLILKVSEDGEILLEKSVSALLFENGLEPLMTATGESIMSNKTWDRELVHLNKIGELPSNIADAFVGFDAGDLVLSLRKYNLVLMVDPNSWRVKWHQTGPWRRQHDPEFNADGTLTVFNNNTYRTSTLGGSSDKVDPKAPLVSNIIKTDPAAGTNIVVYGTRAGETFGTVVRGKHEITPEGGYLVTEFEAGRIFETNAAGKITWEYLNRYDADRVAEVTEARMYPRTYFTRAEWSCP